MLARFAESAKAAICPKVSVIGRCGARQHDIAEGGQRDSSEHHAMGGLCLEFRLLHNGNVTLSCVRRY